MKATPTAKPSSRQQAISVALRRPHQITTVIEDHLNELTALAYSLNIDIIDSIVQSRPSPEPATWIGKGKVDEIAARLEADAIGLVIFDDELSGSQIRNLEKLLKARVITRTELILDIFAVKARSAEAKLQVEMARMEFSLTRVHNLWSHLEGQRGGIGMRGGAGERQIEVDKRQIRERMTRARAKLDEIRQRRAVQRGARLGFPVGAIVGYTNVGKSTLINRLAGTDLYVEDKLFATLDASTRRVKLSEGTVLLTDTVGFIRKFPPQLAASFRSTLEEAVDADFLIHVADASHPGVRDQVATVDAFLAEMGVKDKPILRILNKVDAIKKPLEFRKRRPEGQWISVSAKTGAGIPEVKEALAQLVREKNRETARETAIPKA